VDAGTVDAYLAHLSRVPAEYAALLDVLLINVTRFFRGPEAWQVICSRVLPRLTDRRGPARTLRLWSAGCSSGEEAFTAAMCVSDVLGDAAAEFDVKIYATVEPSLLLRRAGCYRTGVAFQ
jgi:two-component system, chemotaxis family, CheB/CheR fusion protein